MSQDLIALVHRFGSANRDERHEAVHDAYTYICHQAQTVYPETLKTIDPLVALAVDPTCLGRADALQLLADIAGSTNSAPSDYGAARSAVQERLADLSASVTADPTQATIVALAQLAWLFPHDTSIDNNMLETALQQFDEAYVALAVALALQVRGISDAATYAFHTAFAEASGSGDQEPGRFEAALRALRFRSSP